MIILINVFAIVSAALFFFKKISPVSFLLSSVMWFILMITFWFLLPQMIYRKAPTFKDRLRAILTSSEFRIENERGGRSWAWSDFSTWIESPHFFHLYFNSRSFFIVPKDAFSDDEVYEARQMFKEKIQKS